MAAGYGDIKHLSEWSTHKLKLREAGDRLRGIWDEQLGGSLANLLVPR